MVIATAQHFATAVEAAESIDELGNLLDAITGEMGCQYFALSHHVDVPRAPQPAIRIHNYPDEWEEFFDAERLGPSDPVHRASHLTNVGFPWSKLPDLIMLTRRDEEILAHSRRVGLADGFTVPAHIPGESAGSCSFATAHGRTIHTEWLPLAQFCAGRAVFLDLERNRYFCLPDAIDESFRRWSAGEATAPGEMAALATCGVLTESGRGRVRATAHVAALRDHAIDAAGGSVTDAIAAITGQLRARHWLRHRSMTDIVSRLAARRAARGTGQDEARQRRVARAFVASAMLLRAADQCLPRAIAARWLCQRHGQDAALVFGVRLDPFAAHSWAQCGDAVIVGDLENVRLYTPVLVVP